MTNKEQSKKIVYGSLITSTKCYNCIHFPLCFAQKSGANLELASENCCYYQSKLPKDIVVLSREEYEKLKYTWITDSDAYKKGCKDTAEKIYKLVDSKLDLYRNCVIGGTLYDRGYQMAISDIKQKIKDIFGVEIKE